ncbi:MAG: DUF928 domain-containing protein [Cyanobacteriota bacterium SKYGB_h_bin112]|nr:DUF928 domain-containing protein [Cyanobacteriota bacterium SKYGB_h_bin112]
MYANTTRKLLLKVSLALCVGVMATGIPELVAAGTAFNSPPSRGLPGRREGAGTRDVCVYQDAQGRKNPNGSALSVLALTPPTNEGYTLSEHPSFFFYLPRNNARLVQFALTDEDDKEVFKTSYEVAGEAGIINIRMPNNSAVKPLKAGKLYKWKFDLICDPSDPTATIRRYGWIERKDDAALRAKIARATPDQRPQLYAEAGIWFDTLESLYQLRRERPNDRELQADWARVLDAANLGVIAKDPLSTCCQVNATR